MAATTTLPVLFATGVHASRPAASAVGAGGLYSCSTHSLVYQTDGVSTWSTWATLGGSAVTDATISTSDVTTNNVSITKHGWAPKAPNDATKYLDGTGAYTVPAGSGSSLSVPTVSQSVGSTGLNTTNPAITIAAASSGHRLIVGVNLVGRGVTSMTCTNVTFTSMFTATSAGGSHYEIWVGVVAGGSSGTTLTVNTGSSNFSSIVMMEVADTLTPTAGSSYNVDVTGVSGQAFYGPLSGVTAGRFVAMLLGNDNTTGAVIPAPFTPSYAYAKLASGTGLALAVGYAPSGSIGGYMTSTSSSAFHVILGEIT